MVMRKKIRHILWWSLHIEDQGKPLWGNDIASEIRRISAYWKHLLNQEKEFVFYSKSRGSHWKFLNRVMVWYGLAAGPWISKGLSGSRETGVLVCSGRDSRMHRLRGWINRDWLKAGSPRSRCLQGWFLPRSLPGLEMATFSEASPRLSYPLLSFCAS